MYHKSILNQIQKHTENQSAQTCDNVEVSHCFICTLAITYPWYSCSCSLLYIVSSLLYPRQNNQGLRSSFFSWSLTVFTPSRMLKVSFIGCLAKILDTIWAFHYMPHGKVKTFHWHQLFLHPKSDQHKSLPNSKKFLHHLYSVGMYTTYITICAIVV